MIVASCFLLFQRNEDKKTFSIMFLLQQNVRLEKKERENINKINEKDGRNGTNGLVQ